MTFAGALALAAAVAAGGEPGVSAPRAERFPSPAAAVAAFLNGVGMDGATGVVAFGELHQTGASRRGRSTLALFTDDVLPVIAPRVAHLVIETWVSSGACGPAETRVTEDIARTTDRPPETENEIVRLVRRAEQLGVVPHVLDVGCDEYRTLTGADADGGVDYDRLLTLTGAHLRRAIEQAIALPRPAERPLVLVYGGALHNDLAPDPALARYSFGPAVDAATRGGYREIDLYLPALVAAQPALRAEPWYRVWRRAARGGDTILIRRGPRSAIVLPGGPG